MSKKKKNKTPDFKKHGFKSPLELNHSQQLKKLSKKFNVRITYETDFIPYVLERKYNPDFTITHKDGSIFYIESKGYFRSTDRTKLRACLANGSRPRIRLVFAVDNKLHAKSSMRYSDWCKKYGFEYAIGTIPEEWFQ